MVEDPGEPNAEATTQTVRRCVLFADVCDSSRFYRELGDREARRVVRAALDIAKAAVESFGGRVVDTIGDEVFCVLPDADAGLDASAEIHERVADARADDRLPARLGFRVGFVFGDVGVSNDQVFGDNVYLAKRVSSEAKFEETLLTAETRASISPDRLVLFRRVAALRLKGRVDEVEIVEATWGTDVTFDAAAQVMPDEPKELRELVLEAGSNRLVVSQASPTATLGRGSNCELVIADGRVSRLHARVELTGGEFVWIDQSRNGSIIHADGAQPRATVRSHAPLDRSGRIQLGPDADSPTVHYRVRRSTQDRA